MPLSVCHILSCFQFISACFFFFFSFVFVFVFVHKAVVIEEIHFLRDFDSYSNYDLNILYIPNSYSLIGSFFFFFFAVICFAPLPYMPKLLSHFVSPRFASPSLSLYADQTWV